MVHIAVISDIHGNSWALESVLSDIDKRDIDTIFNLGDTLYGPLDPMGTFELLETYEIHHISGNEDRLILEYLNRKTRNKTLSYVLDVIDGKIIQWLKSLKNFVIIDDFYLCHGTPNNDEEYLIEQVSETKVIMKKNKDIQMIIGKIKQHVVCCGHSHIYTVIKLKDKKYVVNPGSVGLQAYDHHKPFYHKMENNHNKATYCIITKDDDDYSFDHKMVPYDWRSAVACAQRNNNEEWATWLKFGRLQKAINLQ